MMITFNEAVVAIIVYYCLGLAAYQDTKIP